MATRPSARSRKHPPAVVEVNAEALAAVLTHVAVSTSPSQVSALVAGSAIALEEALGEHAGPAGILDATWGLRSGDQS